MARKWRLFVLFVIAGSAIAIQINAEPAEYSHTERLARTNLAELRSLQEGQYVEARNLLLQSKRRTQDILDLVPVQGDDKLVQLILAGWTQEGKLYEQILAGYDAYEWGATHAQVEYTPDPIQFIKKKSDQYGKKLVPLMLECLWKSHPGWNPWRKLAAIELLKQHGDASILPPLVDRLPHERDPAVRQALTELILKFGDPKTVERLTGTIKATEDRRLELEKLKADLDAKLKDAKPEEPAAPAPK